MLSHHRPTPTLDAGLTKIGRWPRALSVALFVAIALLAFLVGYAWWWGALGSAAALLFGLSLRVRATVNEKEFIVRSYLRTYRFPFDEVLGFADPPYQGWWSGFVPAELAGLGAYQVDVTMIRRGGGSLPATMCGRRTCASIVTALNGRLSE